MKIRKNAFALLLVLTTMGSLLEGKAKAIVTVTDEKDIALCQSTSFDNRQKQDNYIMLNRPRVTNSKEYLNAYFTSTDHSVYVDGTDPVPMEVFNNGEGYLSIGFQLPRCQSDQCLIDIRLPNNILVVDIGDIELFLTKDPIYWRASNNEGMYLITEEELENSEHIQRVLPKSVCGLRGYMTSQSKEDYFMNGQIDLVPLDSLSKESSYSIKNSISVTELTDNKRLYRYLVESQGKRPVLSVTANYYFKFVIPEYKITHIPDNTMHEKGSKDMVIEGKITVITNYAVSR